MPVVHLALGSNLGDRRGNLDSAVRRLRAEPGIRVLAVSSYYETAAQGEKYVGQPAFLNAAMSIDTEFTPLALLRLLLELEHELGRVRTHPNSPRVVDLDLLLYEQLIIDTTEVTVPHPRLHERGFVLVPLAEIADDVVHPVLNRTIGELREAISDSDVTLAIRHQPLRRRSLLGYRALVTGSTSGIGRAVAEAFADAGASTIVHGRDESKAQTVLRQLAKSDVPSTSILADLSQPEEVQRLADEAWSTLGSGLDILVCNAGADTLTGSKATESFDEKLETLLAVDLKATMRLTRAIGTRMKARGRGVILTIGWDQAETGMEGDSGQLFAAVKGAITCFTRSLAKSLAPEVRVNTIAPGWIRTAWGESASALWQERVRRETPLRVWGLPEDVAATAVWLASPDAAFLTAQTIRVNGGVVG